MNFKKELIEALKTKFEGVQDSILGRIADRLIASGKVKSAEDVATAVEGVTFQQILESYGDSRADEAQKTAVKNYETKHNIKDGKPVEKPAEQKQEEKGGKQEQTGGNPNPDEKIPAWAQALIDSNKSMAQELANMKQEKTANSRQAQLAEILKGTSETVRNRYEKDFARMTFKDDEDFAGWLTEITPDIQQIITDTTPKAPRAVGQPKGGTGTGGQQPKVNPLVQERVDARAKAATTAPAIQGLPQPSTNP